MFKEKLVEVLIRSAMNFEEETHRFYTKCMEMEKDERLSKLFGKLAEEELKHRNRLESLLTTDLDDILRAGEVELDEEIEIPELTTEGVHETGDRALEVLEKALEHEITSRNFYLLLSRRAALSVLKKTFHYLAAQEEYHIKHIRSMMAELKRRS